MVGVLFSCDPVGGDWRFVDFPDAFCLCLVLAVRLCLVGLLVFRLCLRWNARCRGVILVVFLEGYITRTGGLLVC